MKTNKIIIICLVVLVAAGIWLHLQNKKDNKSDSLIDGLFGLFKPKEKKPAFIGDVQPGVTDKVWLMQALGLGDAFLDQFSDADAKTARYYIENYLRKGIKMQITDPQYNNVVRIASYSNLFSKP